MDRYGTTSGVPPLHLPYIEPSRKGRLNPWSGESETRDTSVPFDYVLFENKLLPVRHVPQQVRSFDRNWWRDIVRPDGRKYPRGSGLERDVTWTIISYNTTRSTDIQG